MKHATVQTLALMVLASGIAAGECDPKDHRPACEGTLLIDWRTRYNVVEYDISPVSVELAEGPWHWLSAQNPGYIPCSQRVACTNRDLTYSERREYCWSASGTVSVEAKTGLIARLGAEIGITVEVSTSFQSCKEVTESQTWSIPGSDCYVQYGREVVAINAVEGTVTEHDAVFTWYCYGTGPNPTTLTTYCGTKTGSGNAQQFGRGNQLAPRPAECGGYIPSPDVYDGQRSLPICRPMSGCDVIPPGENPCCGCYVEQ